MYKNLPKFDDNSYAHFITTRTYENRPYFKNDEFSRILLGELRFYSQKYDLTLMGYVIMPNHVHLLLWWDKEEKPELNVSKIVQVIKGTTARRCVDLLKTTRWEHLLPSTQEKQVLQPTHREERLGVTQGEGVFQPTYKGGDGWEHPLPATQREEAGSKSHKRNLKYHLWQPGFYDFNVHSGEKLLEKLNYMHNNPVKAGLVPSPSDYKWSSYKKYFKGKNE